MTSRTRRLIVNWQAPDTRAIVPVAELLIERSTRERYEFGYIRGVLRALQHGFQPLVAFPKLDARYLGAELFAFFRNRVMPTTRPDYPEYVASLGLDAHEGQLDVAEILGRSRGLRQTDRIETVLVPEPDPATGNYLTRFLVRAVRHIEGAEAAIANLATGEQLSLRLDPGNSYNPRARKLVSRCGVIGYLPDYLVGDVNRLEGAGAEPTLVIERINPAPYPPHHRMLVRCEAPWPEGFESLADPEFQPLELRSAVA